MIVMLLPVAIVLLCLQTTVINCRLQTNATALTSNKTGEPNVTNSYNATAYPCPTHSCDCWIRTNPLRYDVRCYITILSKDYYSFDIFNTTSIPGEMQINCDEFDLRQSNLTDGFFSSLHAFYDLRITGCGFNYVPAFAFSGMTALRTLVIKRAKRLVFHEKALENSGSTDLQFVAITGSGMTKAPSLCGVPSVWGINFTDNRLIAFSDIGLTCNMTLPNLEAMLLTNNKIPELPSTLSHYIPNLKRLSIANNMVSRIESQTLGNLSELLWLDIRANTIRIFPSGMIENCTKLHTLFLSDNRIKHFPGQLFTGHHLLTTLEMNNLNLNNSIWIEIQNLTHLQVLKLAGNTILSINVSVMTGLQSLGILDLSANRLTAVDNGTFLQQQNMILVNLSSNHIEQIEEASFHGMPNLKQLDLKDNSIWSIHQNSLESLTSMFLLNLSINAITKLPVFPASLVVLDLRRNRVSQVDSSSFRGLSKLMGLNMRANHLRVIPSKTFETNTQLRLLNLGYNAIEFIEYDALNADVSLQTLVLDHNKISDLGFLRYCNCLMLQTLDLNRNDIESIGPSHFSKSLGEIFLDGNRIFYIAGFTFADLDKLQFVNLRSNKLTSLSNIQLQVSRNNLGTVNYWLAGNPLLCDCHLDWLKRLSVLQGNASRPYLVRDIHSLYCDRVNIGDFGLMMKTPLENFVCVYKNQCLFPCECCFQSSCDCRYDCHDNCTCFHSNNWSDVNIVDCGNSGLTSFPANISRHATMLDFSGNNISVIPKHHFIDISDILTTLYLNSSQIYRIEEEAFAGLSELKYLDLSNNLLPSVIAGMFTGLVKLSSLLLNGNRIQAVHGKAFAHLNKLKLLNIAHNDLQTLGGTAFLSLSRIGNVFMSGNPWSCDCFNLERLKNFTSAYSHKIKDYTSMSCTTTNKTTHQRDEYFLTDPYLPEFCFNDTIIYNVSHIKQETVTFDGGALAALVTVLTIVVIVALAGALIFWQRDFLRVWVYVKFGWKFATKERQDDENRIYDAFVSYSSGDEDFVVHELVPHLETPEEGHPAFRLCVHYRDFPIGASIAETIISSVETSKRVIIVLSDNFLTSEWCQYEFQTAHHKLLEERKNRIILILLHDIDPHNLDKTLTDYIKTRTYVKYGDAWFWQKIELAMPNVKAARPRDAEVPDVVMDAGKQNSRHSSVASEQEGNIMYIMDNMRNYEAAVNDVFDNKGEVELQI